MWATRGPDDPVTLESWRQMEAAAGIEPASRVLQRLKGRPSSAPELRTGWSGAHSFQVMIPRDDAYRHV
jgi:hypothetical protein